MDRRDGAAGNPATSDANENASKAYPRPSPGYHPRVPFRSTVTAVGSPGGSALRFGAAVTVCALAAHAAAHRSLFPDGGGDAYFAWYAPLVAALAGTVLLVAALALAVASVAGPRSRPAAVVRAVFPRPATGRGPIVPVARMGLATLVFLAAQESLEESLHRGRPELATASATTLLILVAVTAIVSGIVVAVARLVSAFAEGVLRVRSVRPHRPRPALWSPAEPVRRARRRPLALHGGLRAPPLGA